MIFHYSFRNGNLPDASQSVDSANVHGAGSTDSLSTGSAECQGGVNLILNLDQGIQHHGGALVQVDLVLLHTRFLLWLVWVPSVDGERLRTSENRS